MCGSEHTIKANYHQYYNIYYCCIMVVLSSLFCGIAPKRHQHKIDHPICRYSSTLGQPQSVPVTSRPKLYYFLWTQHYS